MKPERATPPAEAAVFESFRRCNEHGGCECGRAVGRSGGQAGKRAARLVARVHAYFAASIAGFLLSALFL